MRKQVKIAPSKIAIASRLETVLSLSSQPLDVSAGKSAVVYSTISDTEVSMIALAEIKNLPLHEKLRMMEALWDGIAPQEALLEVLQWLKDLLDDREQLI